MNDTPAPEPASPTVHSALQTISVIIPTYHRPELLRRAVTSVLRQDGYDAALEVIVCVSDRTDARDRAVAESLAGEDPRVRFVVAPRGGVAAARNAGIAAARGDLFAFMDDDCQATPGWLEAGIDGLSTADVVQGKTVPEESRDSRMLKTITIEQLSWLWEACNLFVRRAAVDRAGPFDEHWDPKGRAENAWGEDTEWGWRLIRNGATYAFASGAEVRHVLAMRSMSQVLRHKLDLRYFPMMIRRVPEVRRRFFLRYFLNPRHAMIVLALACAGGAIGSAVAGSTILAVLLGVFAVALVVSPPLASPKQSLFATLNELIGFGVLAYASVRYRRLLL